MSEFLPLFPLSLVVYPGEVLKLHIFEPRYQQLIKDCDEDGIWFGIPPVIEQKMANVATMVELQSIDQRFPSGEANVTVLGKSRFRIEEFYPLSPNKLYAGGKGIEVEEEGSIDPDRLQNLRQEIIDLIFQLHDALGINKQVVSSPDNLTAFKVAHDVGFSLAEEVELLIMTNELARLNYLYDHLQKIIPIVRETERLKARAQLNGHYKNLVPPHF
ncbi:MAG: LON peptidase substrate-binding domain-containing protein [Bacteroidia bacterium]|nr:LON peptidase substrate-binding domain-containing protein [Bacteroidia bacterium]